MFDLQDAADAVGAKVCIIIDTRGDLFASPDWQEPMAVQFPHFLRNVKDRTPKEIEDFKNGWIEALKVAKDAQKKSRIKALKDELATLEKTE